MAARTGRLHFEVLGYDRGHWCNVCQLSTGVRVFVATTPCRGGVTRLEQHARCEDCHSLDVTISPMIDRTA